MSCFTPSAEQARACRAGMEHSLWDSVRALVPDSGLEGSRLRAASLLDFGAYCDLALPYPGGAPVPDDARQEAEAWLLARLGEADSGTGHGAQQTRTGRPPVKTLSADFFSATQIDRLRRWWDIEPDNAMGLTALSPAELDSARPMIAASFDRLHDCAPDLAAEIGIIIGDIVLARPDGSQRIDFTGVSSFALWGAIAINADRQSSWLNFLRTIVHEAAHNLLFALARSEPLVLNDPVERSVSPLRAAPRPLDGIYHAAFVSARECLALESLLCWYENGGSLADADAEAAAEMLEQSAVAFWQCVSTLEAEARLTPLGEAILRDCEDYMRANFALEMQD